MASKTCRVSPGLLFSLLVSSALSRAVPAWADDRRVQLGCPQLTREQAAEVEARVRVALLRAAVPTTRVTITCEPELAQVVVSAKQDRAERTVALGAGDLRESLLAEVDAALQQLAQPPAGTGAVPIPTATSPVATEPPPSPRAPAPPAPRSAAPAQQPAQDAAPAAAAERHAARVELSVQGGAEAWRDSAALGAATGLAYRLRSVSFGVHIGGNTLLATSSDFGIQEWDAAAGVAWSPGWAWGLRGEVELGASLLKVTPRGQLSPRGSTSVAAWYGALSISRPLWLGRAAIVPSVGARAFAVVRRVNVDGHAEVVLGRFVPGFSLGFLYVLN